MRLLKTRLAKLEEDGSAGVPESVHRVVQRLGQTRDDALNEYGRDKIGPKDLTLLRVIVAPLRDVADRLIPQPIKAGRIED